MKKKVFLLTILGLFLCLPALAHQPYYLPNEQGTVQVADPEVSKAYYGQLTGVPQLFEIKSQVDFQLYANILLPDVPEINKQMLVEIWQKGEDTKKLFILDGRNFDWQPFYEEFAGDNYLKGPEIRQQVQAGDYLIQVSSSDNQGKYSLAIGEKEDFPVKEIIRSLIALSQIKTQIFNKPLITAYFNIFGLFIWVPLALLIILIVLIVYFFKRRGKIKNKKLIK